MNYVLQNRLAECRAASGMKKSQLAFRLKMSRAYVTRLERGDSGASLETAIRISRILKKPVEDIFQLVKEDGKSWPAKPTPESDFPFVVGNERGQLITPKKERKQICKSK